jgi:hypothetical protein
MMMRRRDVTSIAISIPATCTLTSVHSP